MSMVCDHCDNQARHMPSVGDTLAGVKLCCEHMDELMGRLAQNVPATEGAFGLRLWHEEHEAMCRGGSRMPRMVQHHI